MARKDERKGKAEVYRNMSAIRSKENRTETGLRKALFALGFRYRKYKSGLIGHPDIVFARARVVVFVDGDYWHGRLLREQGPVAVQSYFRSEQHHYWLPKLQNRVVRDDFVTSSLQGQGWTVLRFWESDVRKNLLAVRDQIAEEVKRRLEQRPSRVAQKSALLTSC